MPAAMHKKPCWNTILIRIQNLITSIHIKKTKTYLILRAFCAIRLYCTFFFLWIGLLFNSYVHKTHNQIDYKPVRCGLFIHKNFKILHNISHIILHYMFIQFYKLSPRLRVWKFESKNVMQHQQKIIYQYHF